MTSASGKHEWCEGGWPHVQRRTALLNVHACLHQLSDQL